MSKEDGESTIKVLESLQSFGESTPKEEVFEDAIGEVAKSLGAVGTAAAKKNLDDATSRAAVSLVYVGRIAAENKFEDAASQAAESLAELTISSGEITRKAIDKYESRLEEQDRVPFKNFIKAYEQELETLRAPKN